MAQVLINLGGRLNSSGLAAKPLVHTTAYWGHCTVTYTVRKSLYQCPWWGLGAQLILYGQMLKVGLELLHKGEKVRLTGHFVDFEILQITKFWHLLTIQ